MSSRRWNITGRVFRYAVYGTAAVGTVLAIIGIPSWLQWALAGAAAACVVAAYGCVWMYGLALRAERIARTPDLGDVAQYFNNCGRG